MEQLPKTTVKVISQKGFCGAKHKKGDSWEVSLHTPAGICQSAWNVMYPYLNVLKYGGTFPWAENPDVVSIACSDAENPVVFEIRRSTD